MKTTQKGRNTIIHKLQHRPGKEKEKVSFVNYDWKQDWKPKYITGSIVQVDNKHTLHDLMHVTLREFAGDPEIRQSDLINPLFPIEITQPRVPGIASNFLKLTFNVYLQILGSKFGNFALSGVEIALQGLSGFGCHCHRSVTSGDVSGI